MTDESNESGWLLNLRGVVAILFAVLAFLLPGVALSAQPTVSDQGGQAMSEVEKQSARTGAQPQSASKARAAQADAIRPFRAHFSDAELAAKK